MVVECIYKGGHTQKREEKDIINNKYLKVAKKYKNYFFKDQ